jgi:hypothetical protein
MARKRTELGPTVDAEIAARTARGESAETIWEAIGRRISVPTIKRRQAELRRRALSRPLAATPKRASVTPPVQDNEVPDEIPEATPIEDLNRWIARLEKAADSAEAAGNLAALSSIAQKVAALMTLRHRATPLPKADPNDNHDFKVVATEARTRLAKLAHALFTDR